MYSRSTYNPKEEHTIKKRKNIAIPMILAATIAAVSVNCSSQIVMASDTYQVGVSKGYLALRSAKAYDSSNEISYIPAIQFSLWIQLMHSTGMFTPRNSANMVM